MLKPRRLQSEDEGAPKVLLVMVDVTGPNTLQK
jgi:hypothetical protein